MKKPHVRHCPICNRRLFFQERKNDEISFFIDWISIPCIFYCPNCKLTFKYQMDYQFHGEKLMEGEE